MHKKLKPESVAHKRNTAADFVLTQKSAVGL